MPFDLIHMAPWFFATVAVLLLAVLIVAKAHARLDSWAKSVQLRKLERLQERGAWDYDDEELEAEYIRRLRWSMDNCSII